MPDPEMIILRYRWEMIGINHPQYDERVDVKKEINNDRHDSRPSRGVH